MILLFILNFAFADTIFISENVNPQDLKLATFETLWAAQEAHTFTTRPIREDLVQYSLDFLEQRLSSEQYGKLMLQWSQAGWSAEEKTLLIDVLNKSTLKITDQKNWECRLSPTEACARETLNPQKLPFRLIEFEWIVIDGKPLPREQWDYHKISKTEHSWLFLSSKYKPISFDGTFSDLQKHSFQIRSWVQGSCDSFEVDSSIQDLQSRIYFSKSCQKPALATIKDEKSFYEKYKKPIWWTVGLAVGASLLTSMQGKKIVIQKPGFM